MADEGAVTVCVRVRPLISREQDLGDAAQLHWKTEDRLISQIDGTRSFSFDRVFHSNETTEKVYEEMAVPIIRSAIQGYNGTIFAYGQTASGKTYTMMGSADGLGVIPKAINDIFIKIKEIPEREFLLRVSYMEIYNETITDLLCDTRKMKPLEIREDFNRNVYVADLTEEVVSTPELALQWIKKGERSRHYGKTKMNQRSSRSHTIFRMILESREKGDPSNCDGAVMVSHLNLVDLAGSERASQTGSEGVRLKEGCNINRSLFILGQVIKKLSDGQAGGFINYRDSKLTRILQNSLGGNAKTLIICTITPVSFDETLSTLQFASTAKYMKNTPHVNEVLDDEALLKRYRKEIIDLKKQLEEVSSETRVQAMEKDQLAQLLEEKDLLQKVQNDKIHNLTQMLVTSSSVTLQQDLKAKRKRRVTWCPGKTNKMKDIGYMDDFDTTKTIVAKSIKAPIPSIVETDESMCSEFDIFSNTFETISETEWNPATKLNQETVQNELNSLRANFDNLVLDYEQLQRKKTEMELKLNEKLELDEFVTLEVQTIKEQENELNLKSQLLKEKEEQIMELQKLLELRRVENMKMDFSTSVENHEKLYEELKHLKQSLHDTETIALDAKKEAAFLRSENQDLKEKMEELSSRCKQLEKENHQYQSQLEERKDTFKRRQADLERELQSAFNEITKLTSIIDGKYPKGFLLAVELERKVKDLQKDLDKEIEENAALQKEINILSELKSLPTELEILRKERVEKSEELDLIMAEKDKLLTEVVYKDNRLQELLDEIEKTKEELVASQSNHETTTQEYQDFKRYNGELEQNYFTMLEEMEKMKQQIITISEEAHEVVLDLDDLVSEPSIKLPQKVHRKTLEQEKLLEVRELCRAQQKLEEQLNSGDSGLRTVEMEKLLLTAKPHESLEGRPGTYEKDALEQPQETLEREKDQLRKDSQDDTNLAVKLNEGQHLEAPRSLMSLTHYEKDNELLQQQRHISSLIQENNQLQQMLECVTAERNQLKTDLEENIEMTIENQEELRNIGAALKQQREAVIKERRKAAEKEGECLLTQERLADTEEKLNEKIQELQEKEEQILNVRKEVIEAQEKMKEMEQLKDQLKSTNSTLERVEMENLELAQKLQVSLEETTSVTKEINELKKTQVALQLEKDQLEENIREVVTKGLETQEELKIAQMHLKEHQETIDKLKECISEQAAQGLNDQEDLEKTNAELQEKIQELQAKQDQILNVREEVNEAQEKMKEMESIKEQLKSKESALKRVEMENLELAQKLQASVEETTSVTEERDELTKTLLAVQEESHQLKENIRELEAKGLDTQEELKIAQISLKEHQEMIDKLKECVSEKTAQVSEAQEALEKTNIELQKRIQELQGQKEQVFNVREEITEAQEKVNEVEQLKEQLKFKDSTLERIEMENLELAQKLQASLEETTSVTEERDELAKTQEALHIERDQLKETIRDLIAKDLETQEKLKVAQIDLKEHQDIMYKLKECISEKEAIEKTSAELQEKIQELEAKQEQFFNVREEVSEAQEKMKEMEHLKEQLKSKDSTLERIEMENLELAQKLQASLEETTSVTKERDELAKTQEALHIERDQLKETIRDLIAKDLEIQEKLKVAQMHLKEHQEIIDKLKECISEKAAQVSEAQEAFKKINAELQKRIQELQEQKEQVCNIRKEVTEAQVKVNEVEQLKEQLKSKDSTLEKIEMENLELAQKLQASLEETKSVTKERDELTKTQEALHIERDQLKETIRDLIAKDLETQEKLKVAQMDLKEHQDTMDKLKECISEKEAIEKTSAELQEKIQELEAKQEQFFNVREEVSEAQEKMKEMEHLKEQLKSKDSTLERIEMENLELAQKLQASLEETTSVTEERDELAKTQEALHIERDQLKETIRDLIAKDQETQEELKFAEMCLKEHQETIHKLKECISEKTTQVSKSQEALEKTNAGLQEKILKLQETEEVLLSVRKEVNETKLQRQSLSQMAEQLKHMTHTCPLETEKLDLTQKLDSSLSKLNTVIKERDALKETEKALQMEVNHLKESLKKSGTLDQQKPEELVNIEANPREGTRHHPIENLKEKYSKINELLKKYTMIENRCGFLNRLSLDLKRSFESQNQLQVKVQACLSHTPQETKAVGKLLASNRRCNNDLHSSSTCILKKLEGVLKRVIDIRREHHNTIYKIEMDLIEEAEKQNDLSIKIQHLQQHSEIGSQELSGYKKLSQKMGLHIEQIFKDVSETENDINNMVAEFQQLLNAKKEIILSLEMSLSTHLDVESLRIIQEENDRIVHVNNLYHNKIKAIMNKSSEFEDRSVVVCKEWELELRQMKDKNEEMVKKFQNVKTTLLPLDDPDALTVGENKKHHLKLRHTRQTTKEIQETAFHEDKENKHKQKEIDPVQKNLEVAKVVSNQHLQSQQPAVHSCQDVKAVSSKEIDDLKMKLVKLNMEKMNESKKFEKEIASKAAVIEHQEEMISQLKEHLRRAQQSNDVSMLEPPGHAQASHTPLTCGGGSGIVQSTKALILKADRVRLEREISKLKQQNEYLTNHQSQLSSNNFHLAREVKKWKERALKKEAQELTRVHSPKSPKLTEITSLKRQCMSPLYTEQTSQETLPKDSPKSWAYDGRSKSLPVVCHNNYFDNSGLGLLPEIAFSSTNDSTKETPREENTGSLLDQWQTSSGKDAPECRTQ
uniref:Centromere-associated protein E n=1 Tax=Phascolarctos cinereus TaxID=38626 RepID=A0A6P5M2S8_PHACI|nr:LOW QUALITY PROTEIN: centromere-associated protein E [Phascolarctos cinereus]